MGRGHQSKYFSRVVEGAIFQWALLAVGVVTYKLYNTAEYSVLSLLLAVPIAIAPNEVRVSRCWTMSNSHRPQKSLGLVLDSHCSISTHSWIDINFIIRKWSQSRGRHQWERKPATSPTITVWAPEPRHISSPSLALVFSNVEPVNSFCSWSQFWVRFLSLATRRVHVSWFHVSLWF